MPDAIPLGDKGPVEAIHGLWGERPYQQRSLLTEARARAITALEAWDTELRGRDPRCALPALGYIAKFLGGAYMGYDATEHELLIRAIQAASVNNAVTVQGKEDAPP
jgi:hypothetical protein